MSISVVVPELGESLLEATIAHWLKQEGDRVEQGEPLVELETDKVNLEVPALQAGILKHIARKEQEDVKVGDVIGTIEEVGEPAPGNVEAVAYSQIIGPAQSNTEVTALSKAETPALSNSEAQASSQVEIPSALAANPATPLREEETSITNDTPQPSSFILHPSSIPHHTTTPVAERLVRDLGVDISNVPGTGPGGRVTKTDVENYLQQQPPQTKAEPLALSKVVAQSAIRQSLPATPERREERIKMSRRRRTIAQRLVEVHLTAAMLTTFNEADMTRVMDLRKRRNESFQERYRVKLGITSFFVKAAIGALKSFPLLNAEVQGDEMLVKYYYDIGVAVGSPEGLVVPVMRDADRMSFAEMEAKIAEFVRKTEQGKLTLEDLRGGTFSITNGGVFGSLMSTPILTPPQVGILGLHKIEKRPVVIDDQITIRPMMYLALSYDHRIVDGREAVQFLVRVKELIEDPASMLLEG